MAETLSVGVRIVGGEVERAQVVATLVASLSGVAGRRRRACMACARRYEALVARRAAGAASPAVGDDAWEGVGRNASLELPATRFRGPLRVALALGPGAATPPAGGADGFVVVCRGDPGAWGARWASAAAACDACLRVATSVDAAFDADLAAWAAGNGFESRLPAFFFRVVAARPARRARAAGT